MGCISMPMAALLSGGIGAIGGIAQAGIGANAATRAAKIQADAAKHAADAEMKMYDTTRNDLMPYMDVGRYGSNMLMQRTPELTRTFQPTMEELAATPGYQFTREQGLRATQNTYAAKGLGSSGAAQRGAVDYAEGLATTTYQQQFQNYLAQNQQIYNMLLGETSLGENAAAQAGNLGLGFTNAAQSALMQGASASASGIIGAANALMQGIGTVTGNIGNSALLLGMNSNGMFGPSGAGAGSSLAPTMPGMNPAATPTRKINYNGLVPWVTE